MEDVLVKRPRPILTEEEQARVNALRQARKGRRGSRGYRALPNEKRQAAKAAYDASQERKRLEQERLDRERAAVSAKSARHIARLQEACIEDAPWDDEFIDDLRSLLDRGYGERALAVGRLVAIASVPWNLPDDSLAKRLQRVESERAEEAKTDRRFMAFVRGPLSSAHQKWAKSERRRELAKFDAIQPAAVDDRELERQRRDATALRRPISKRY